MKFNVTFFQVNERDRCPMINIETDTIKDKDSFCYSNIFGMYMSPSSQGHGIQVNNSKIEKPLLEMCDKIAQAVYEYKRDIKNEMVSDH